MRECKKLSDLYFQKTGKLNRPLSLLFIANKVRSEAVLFVRMVRFNLAQEVRLGTISLVLLIPLPILHFRITLLPEVVIWPYVTM